MADAIFFVIAFLFARRKNRVRMSHNLFYLGQDGLYAYDGNHLTYLGRNL